MIVQLLNQQFVLIQNFLQTLSHTSIHTEGTEGTMIVQRSTLSGVDRIELALNWPRKLDVKFGLKFKL